MEPDRNSEKLEYDVQQRARAGTRATFRGVAALYIAYLGYRLIRGAESGMFTAVGVVFILAALGFGYYILKRWRLDVEAARIKEETEEITGEEPPEE